MLKCPLDRIELVEQIVGSTDLLSCPECGGIWLPRSARVELVDPERVPSTKRSAPGQSVRPRKYRACPHCKISMSPQRVEGIEIDRCLTCDGIWLDAGEYPAVRHRISIDRGETLPEKKAGVLGAGTPLEIVLDIVIGLLEILP